MNKTRRVAIEKHRERAKKIKEKRKVEAHAQKGKKQA